MASFRVREAGEHEIFDPLALCPETPFTQAHFYGAWQQYLGREVRRFVILQDGKDVAYFQLVKYPLMFGMNYLYAPYGPVVAAFSEELLVFLKEEITKIARDSNAVFVRLDFTPPVSREDQIRMLARQFTKASLHTYRGAYFQPRAEWYLNLAKTEEELLKDMHEKTRYSVRLAGRKGITAEIVTSDLDSFFPVFYELMCGTARRNGFSLHGKEYYRQIFRHLDPQNVFLAVARYGEKILSVYLVIRYGRVANYVFGGSSDEHRERVPTYLAHWAAICHAKKTGAAEYNFGGISFGDVYKAINMDSLTTFKKKFGGREIVHSDFYDVVVKPLWYRLYNFRKRVKSGI